MCLAGVQRTSSPIKAGAVMRLWPREGVNGGQGDRLSVWVRYLRAYGREYEPQEEQQLGEPCQRLKGSGKA
jgi:hypothetical protein